ncbi:MAG: hypothetical protein COA66_00730 [Arcobacter sp.]|nr:MAG: hypothetical protein COA66_00730 [Arcobacter sp.]
MKMSLKDFFGYLLILFTFSLILIVTFPQVYSNNSFGRIDKKILLDFDFLKKEKKPIILLFFGFVSCGDICTPAMNELKDIYGNIQKDKVSVYFLNVLNTTDKEAPVLYAKTFNKNFIGLYLEKEEINKISLKLDLAISKISKERINHTGHLFLLDKDLNSKYNLKYIYTTRPFDKKSIAHDINTLSNEREEK